MSDMETMATERDESAQLNELAAALAKAQGQIRAASTDAVNPHFRSKYSTLAAVWDACREPLSSNGLSVLQRVSSTAAGVIVTTQLLHSSGQWLKDRFFLPVAQKTPQGYGSAITYAKRYALSALVGVASAEDDDDGNAATGAPQKRAEPSSEPSEAVVPFGKNKGTPLSKLGARQLEWYAEKAREELADPEKTRYHATARAWLEQLERAKAALQQTEC